MLLAGTAGYIDSYTFAFHDNRFASFQSGNLLQLSINVASGKWHAASLFSGQLCLLRRRNFEPNHQEGFIQE